MKKKNYGFTLIELLIVVAIIAILAAIAIPNFLAAQTRSKVSRAKGEMRSLTTGLESYYTDYNCYPGYRWTPSTPTGKPCSWRFWAITTPVAYITKVPKDPFPDPARDPFIYDTYDYFDEQYFLDLYPTNPDSAKASWGGHTWGRAWRMASAGPDLKQDYAKSWNSPFGTWLAWNASITGCWPNYYDPTNGTISNGDVLRFGGTGKLSYGGAIANEIINN